MSYDVIASCPHCGSRLADWSPTYNYSAMFVALGIYPRDFNGKPSREYADALERAHEALSDRMDEFKQHDAKNGWGTAEQLRDALPEMVDAFRRAGEAPVVVS